MAYSLRPRKRKKGHAADSVLLSLPEETINHILSYSLPCKECQVWEWVGVISQTCRMLRPMAQSFVPTRLMLGDFQNYQSCIVSSQTIDARLGILQSLRDFDWKCQNLKELHVNWSSVLELGPDGIQCSTEIHDDIRTTLHTILTTANKFPKMEWLDINVQSDDVYDFNLVDAQFLQGMPSALPSLQKLCLCACFKNRPSEVTPYELTHFFNSMQSSLTSLSFCDVNWMTDAHVESIMPLVGKQLSRLELVECKTWDCGDDEENWCDYDSIHLTDRSLVSIAHNCSRLTSFSMVDSWITTLGVEHVLKANANITTLNLSDNEELDSTVVDIISQYLPKLQEIRNYWADRNDWLTDDGLIALIDAQMKYSGGSAISLKLIGLYYRSSSTIRGLQYAIEKGVQEVEIDTGALCDSIVALKSNVKVSIPQYVHYMDGCHPCNVCYMD